jgi:hypothetical protein
VAVGYVADILHELAALGRENMQEKSFGTVHCAVGYWQTLILGLYCLEFDKNE